MMSPVDPAEFRTIVQTIHTHLPNMSADDARVAIGMLVSQVGGILTPELTDLVAAYKKMHPKLADPMDQFIAESTTEP